MVAVVPTGRLCKISSSLSDFSSEEEEKCEYTNSASSEMEAEKIFITVKNIGSGLSTSPELRNDHIDRICNHSHADIGYKYVNVSSRVQSIVA